MPAAAAFYRLGVAGRVGAGVNTIGKLPLDHIVQRWDGKGIIHLSAGLPGLLHAKSHQPGAIVSSHHREYLLSYSTVLLDRTETINASNGRDSAPCKLCFTSPCRHVTAKARSSRGRPQGSPHQALRLRRRGGNRRRPHDSYSLGLSPRRKRSGNDATPKARPHPDTTLPRTAETR